MRVALVGADFEENLGVGMIAAATARAGHSVRVRTFNYPDESDSLARDLSRDAPDVVGLSIQFQHRAAEFLGLARALRAHGYRGHVTVGGQWPTLAWRELLSEPNAVDSVVLHEGEDSFPELLDALASARRPHDVPGLALRAGDGTPVRTAARALVGDLDRLPFPTRYRPHARHLGIPFIPILGSRGCWGSCSYCSITSFYRDARSYGGGKTLRERSPENVAQEMALLWQAGGGAGIFCFHDDNFLRPRPSDTLARLRAIRESLSELGVREQVGIVGKARPDCITPELAKAMRELGVIRLYVGVENASQQGADHLGRKTQALRVHEALGSCREAGIFVCYNLLLFEPDATIAHVKENVAFIRDHASHPVNFCRAEPYFGTPLHLGLAARGAVEGSHLGYSYRIADDPTEVLFRVCAAAFRQRNFEPAGVANRNMGLGYSLKIVEHYYEDPRHKLESLARRTEDLTRSISLETARFLESAIDLVERLSPHDPDRLARETVLLGLRIAEADRRQHAALDSLYADMNRFAEEANRPPPPRPSRRLAQIAQGLALSASLALWGSACNGCGPQRTPDPTGNVNPPPPDPVPPPTMPPPDPVPPPTQVMPPDPVPPPTMPPPDPVPPPTQVMPVDPPPPPTFPPPDPVPPPTRVMPVDPPPPPTRPPVVDPVPSPHKSIPKASLAIIDKWTDTSAPDVARSADLPLADPPQITLTRAREGADGATEVTLAGGPEALSIRWRSAGRIEGTGRVVRWWPASITDSLRVAVRSEGGVAIASLRAREVHGEPPPEAGT